MSDLRDFLQEVNLRATPKSNQSIIEVALDLILNSQKGPGNTKSSNHTSWMNLPQEVYLCSKSGNDSKYFDIEIQFANGQQSNLEISIRREKNGIHRVFDANDPKKVERWLY